MRQFVPVALLIAGLAASPALAAPQTSSTKPAAKSSKAPAEHSIKGVIKSIDASSLTLTSGKKDVTFALGPSTQREGQLTAGTTVSIRYHEDGSTKMAMAVVAQPVKPAAAKTTAK